MVGCSSGQCREWSPSRPSSAWCTSRRRGRRGHTRWMHRDQRAVCQSSPRRDRLATRQESCRSLHLGTTAD
jgi:hypothetical protein